MAKKETKWAEHLKSVRNKNPGMSLSDAMKEASKTYTHVKSDQKHQKERKAAREERNNEGKGRGGAQADPLAGEGSATADAINGAPTSAIKSTGHEVQLASTGATGAARKGKKGKTMKKKIGARKGKSHKH